MPPGPALQAPTTSKQDQEERKFEIIAAPLFPQTLQHIMPEKLFETLSWRTSHRIRHPFCGPLAYQSGSTDCPACNFAIGYRAVTCAALHRTVYHYDLSLSSTDTALAPVIVR